MIYLNINSFSFQIRILKTFSAIIKPKTRTLFFKNSRFWKIFSANLGILWLFQNLNLACEFREHYILSNIWHCSWPFIIKWEGIWVKSPTFLWRGLWNWKPFQSCFLISSDYIDCSGLHYYRYILQKEESRWKVETFDFAQFQSGKFDSKLPKYGLYWQHGRNLRQFGKIQAKSNLCHNFAYDAIAGGISGRLFWIPNLKRHLVLE